MAKTLSAEIVINGSHGEGGGALFRTSVAIAAITQQQMRIHHIRGGTRKAGLTSEDLTFLEIMEATTNATLIGADLGSEEMTFAPRQWPRPVRMHVDVRSHEKGSVPGNALMVAQSAIPVLARTGGISSIIVRGETYNPNTLTFDAFQQATQPLHSKQGLVFESMLLKAGFGFASMGEVQVTVEPSAIHGFEWTDRGAERGTHGVFAYSGIPPEVLERAEQEARKLAHMNGLTLSFDLIEVNSTEPGIFVTFVSRYEKGMGTGSAMGQRSVRVESVIRRAWEQLMTFAKSSAAIDPFLADQLLIPAAFSGETTTFTTQNITPRLQTMAWVIKQFVPIAITISGRAGEPGKVTIKA